MTDSRPTLRQRLEDLGLRGAAGLVVRLPYRWVRPLAHALGSLVYVFDARGRAVALANIESAFGDRFSPARRREIARGSYQTFARTMLELFWAPNLTREMADRLVKVEGLELDSCHHDKTCAAVYPCLHFSNFEWLGQICAYAIVAGPIIAQRFKNPLLGPIFDHLRASSGHEVIPQERAMIRMLKHLKSGGKFGMLPDLNLDPDEGSVLIECFGGLKTSVTQIHAALSLRTGAKIIPCECRPDGAGYRMIFHRALEFGPDTPPEKIAQLCWDALEPAIHAHPECWLWPYKHWRFKPSGDASGRYPFYANTAKRFDKLIKQTANREGEPPGEPLIGKS